MKVIQILGLFNSGTNLLFTILDKLFDVNVGSEGHTLFWKHTVVGKQFSKKHVNVSDNNYYLIVTKNPYFQFQSFKKSPYSIKLKHHNMDKLSLGEFVNKTIYIALPKNVITDLSTLNFKNCPHYWNKFHSSAFKHLPPNKTIVVRYEDLLFNSDSVVKELMKFFPLKKQYVNNELQFKNTLNTIFNTPAKSSGHPRFGSSAKQFYSSNVENLYNKQTLNWISSELNEDIMNILRYDIVKS